MAIVDDNYILKLEQLRIKLIGILRSKEMIVDENETLDNLIPMVDKISNLKGLCDRLSGSLKELNDNNINFLSMFSLAYIPTLKRVKLNNATSIKNSCFKQCTGLTNIYLPQVLTTESSCFEGCSSLVNIILPNVTTLGATYVFSTCSKLKRIIVPKSLSSGGGGNFFNGCSNLILYETSGSIGCNVQNLEVLILRKEEQLQALSSVAFIANIKEIYVHQELLETYKVATNWSTYADKIFPLEGSKYENEDWYKKEDWYAEEMSVWQ